ncbi:MAG: tetratricopeptide repeat protein [Leptolyngbyaceae cyanobacterium SM1_3_5]|nr:tetratricopeptide repeat protein [Leptolyngbyaceae cyanobacterium SM1_3_5]
MMMTYFQALCLQPSWATAEENCKLGNHFLQQEQWQQAIACYERAIEQDAALADARFGLGTALQKTGQLERAIEAYERAIELQPEAWLSYHNLGDIFLEQKCWDEAVEAYQRTIKLNSNYSWSYHNLGDALRHRENWDAAIEAYRKAIELNSNFHWSHHNLGEVLAKLEQWDEAIEAYKHGLKVHPQNTELSEQLVMLQQQYVKVTTVIDEDQAEAQQSLQFHAQPTLLNSKAKIVVFMPYYKAKFAERQDEYISCLRKNIECCEIEKIYLLIDDGHEPEIRGQKVEIINTPSRPTYLDWVELTKKYCREEISVLANTDIYFDESVSRLRELFSADPTGFVSLSRYEKEGSKQTLHSNPHWSQDVWAISGKYEFSESFKQSLIIPLGTPRCDNKIAYLFSIHGSKIYNPCYHIRTIHVHETQLRNYDKKGDTTILGATAWVYPSKEIDEPSKLLIDVWTLDSDSVVGVRTNDTLVKWRKEQESSKEELRAKGKPANGDALSVVAHDSDWQYPAITEKHAYDMAKKLLPQQHDTTNVVYFGFPWATLIDKLLHGVDKNEADALMEKLGSFKGELKKYTRIITVCQHVRLLEFEEIFNEVGVTDIFWSHTVKDQKVLPSYPNTLLHPFPLYPVQAIDDNETEAERVYLYSFNGSHAPENYLTDIRNKIIDHLSNDSRGCIVASNQWYYQKVVYEHQIWKSIKETDNLVDKDASEKFKQLMKQSMFALCPSGSGPNSIRLWEAIGLGAIPVVLADTYLPPGDLALWYEAIVACPETLDDIKALPDRLAKMQQNKELLERKRDALKQLWKVYGTECFIHDVVKLFTKYVAGDIPAISITVNDSTVSKFKANSTYYKRQSKNLKKEDFKPSYVWPNPTFPFRLYYDSPKCRIFIIENVQHNWNWMAECHERFRKTDFFFVTSNWYQSSSFANEADTIFSILNLDKSQFFFLYNSPLEMQNFREKGFQGEVINCNAWIDEKSVTKLLNVDKLYHAVYVEFDKKLKRPLLASQVSHLALVTRESLNKNFSDIPSHSYLNNRLLSPEELCEKINQAHCGLILSEEEGACFASSEYLLCGIPVVSTLSRGGRDVWYNDYNSVICQPTVEGVAAAVEEFVRNPRDPQKVHQMHTEQAERHRLKFIKLLADIFKRFDVNDVDSVAYFREGFFHKMMTKASIDVVKSYFGQN